MISGPNANLRELAAQAHQIELEAALDDLMDQFRGWKEEQQDAFELNEKIHEFHNGKSRELHKDYVFGDAKIAVAAAISRKTLDPDKIEENIMERLCPLTEAFSRGDESNDDGAT